VQEAPLAPADDDHQLLAAGWKPGVLFDAPGAVCGWNIAHDNEAGSLQIVGQPRTIRKSERLVLISHPCDITSRDEERVEALICKRHSRTKNREWLKRVERNSARYFVVDPEAAYVAVASYRIQIAKEALSSLAPDPLVMDEVRLSRFIDWLARRYDRPTISDRIYNTFHRPIYAALEKMDADPVMSAFNDIVHEIRVKPSQRHQAPYDMGLLFLVHSEAYSVEGATAIDAVAAAIESELDPNQIDLPLRIEYFPVDEVPYRVILRTQPLMLEYLSYEGEEIAGAPPPRAFELLAEQS
jgi:hypothetical protein